MYAVKSGVDGLWADFVLFPAPQPSYTPSSFFGELCWIGSPPSPLLPTHLSPYKGILASPQIDRQKGCDRDTTNDDDNVHWGGGGRT